MPGRSRDGRWSQTENGLFGSRVGHGGRCGFSTIPSFRYAVEFERVVAARRTLGGMFGRKSGWSLSCAMLLTLVACSSVHVEVEGAAPHVSEIGVTAARADVLRALRLELRRRGLRVVEAGAAAFEIRTELMQSSRDAAGSRPVESWVRGGVSGDPQYGGGAPWLEIGREVDYPENPPSGAPQERDWTSLTLFVVSRRSGRIVWRGSYKDAAAPDGGSSNWASWLEAATFALVKAMTKQSPL